MNQTAYRNHRSSARCCHSGRLRQLHKQRSARRVNGIVQRGQNGSLNLWCAGLTQVSQWIQGMNQLGRRLLVIRRDRNVARVSGMNVSRIWWGALIAFGFVSGLAGVIYAGNNGSADLSSAQAVLPPAFAAAFLGGTAIIARSLQRLGGDDRDLRPGHGDHRAAAARRGQLRKAAFYGGVLVMAVALSQIARRRVALDTG